MCEGIPFALLRPFVGLLQKTVSKQMNMVV